jgi:hypothetical protein
MVKSAPFTNPQESPRRRGRPLSPAGGHQLRRSVRPQPPPGLATAMPTHSFARPAHCGRPRRPDDGQADRREADVRRRAGGFVARRAVGFPRTRLPRLAHRGERLRMKGVVAIGVCGLERNASLALTRNSRCAEVIGDPTVDRLIAWSTQPQGHGIPGRKVDVCAAKRSLSPTRERSSSPTVVPDGRGTVPGAEHHCSRSVADCRRTANPRAARHGRRSFGGGRSGFVI